MFVSSRAALPAPTVTWGTMPLGEVSRIHAPPPFTQIFVCWECPVHGAYTFLHSALEFHEQNKTCKPETETWAACLAPTSNVRVGKKYSEGATQNRVPEFDAGTSLLGEYCRDSLVIISKFMESFPLWAFSLKTEEQTGPACLRACGVYPEGGQFLWGLPLLYCNSHVIQFPLLQELLLLSVTLPSIMKGLLPASWKPHGIPLWLWNHLRKQVWRL